MSWGTFWFQIEEYERVKWDHRPPGRFARHDKICDILRAARLKVEFLSTDMLSLRIYILSFVVVHNI